GGVGGQFGQFPGELVLAGRVVTAGVHAHVMGHRHRWVLRSQLKPARWSAPNLSPQGPNVLVQPRSCWNTVRRLEHGCSRVRSGEPCSHAMEEETEDTAQARVICAPRCPRGVRGES